MTKLNYSNRKSEGVKLGTIVAKDLRRRTKSLGSSTAANSPIDLNLEGKHLTDAGVAEFASTLAEVLTPVNGTAAARLQFLHLKDNDLTAKSLEFLAPCIEAAADELESLDLSSNRIEVNNDSEAASWRRFLQSFRFSKVLRTLDLSQNNLSNFQAFEILYQEYIRQWTTDMNYCNTSLDTTSESGEDDLEYRLGALSVRDTNAQQQVTNGHEKRPSNQKRWTASGLPMIPIISFEDVSITDPGALFLSFVIQRHMWLQQERLGRKWLVSKDEADRAMIEITGNVSMAPMGTKMLADAQLVEFDPLAEKENKAASNWLRRRESSITDVSRRTSGANDPSRKGSIASAGTDNCLKTSPTFAFSDLSNSRKRVQRSIIQNPGVSHVRLWHTSLRLLFLVRCLVIKERTATVSPPRLRRQHISGLSIESTGSGQDQTSPSPQPTYASKLMFDRTRQPSGSPVLSIIGESDERDRATTPTVLRTTRQTGTPEPKQRSCEDNGSRAMSPIPAPELKGAISVEDPQEKMIGVFPEKIWKRILRKVVDGDEVLSGRHIDSIFEYGADRRTIELERELLGKSDSVQIWKCLDFMGCLTY